MPTDELYMLRCIELAKLGVGHVTPNPMVGAVLVHEGKIIGEGFHQKYGEAHAEVNCINSVEENQSHLIEQSTLYVSLEPCAHFGKTPPCADLIIQRKIPKVIIGCRDPFKEVNGKGIEKLIAAGVEVITSILEKECLELNKRFFLFHTETRPYIILKWAQSSNQKIANADRSRVLITNEFTNRIVHQWRGKEAGIMVGTNTALHDNPELNTRKYPATNPVRLIVDINLRLPTSLNIFNQQQRTIIFNKLKHVDDGNISYYQVTEDVSLVHLVMNACYQLNIQSVLVEGGAYLLQSFIDARFWDEARVITNNDLVINNGLHAPSLNNYQIKNTEQIFSDTIQYCTPV